MGKVELALDRLRKQVLDCGGMWVIAYSGGKDSAATLKLFWHLLANEGIPGHLMLVYYDTGVDTPPIADFVRSSLHSISDEAEREMLSLSVRIAKPRPSYTYFVRVIGRGYPPPTNSFRWCTKWLRIRSVQDLMSSLNGEYYVATGLRTTESEQRKRSLAHFATGTDGWFYQGDRRHQRIYCPIHDFETPDVWELLVELSGPESLDVSRLAQLYRAAGGECPVIRDPRDSACSKGRFGCWTCTVIKKDRSGEGLLESGFDYLRPLIEFRNWLADVRNRSDWRCRYRRNGSNGPGPFTLAAREAILAQLRRTEAAASRSLLTEPEHQQILRLWEQDRCSASYWQLE